MDNRINTGKKGEAMAVLFLKRIGFRIIALNWRYKKLEIDIIAEEQGILVFVEVKVRSSPSHGVPGDLIGVQKRDCLFRAAEAYISASEHTGEIRFDVITFIDNKLDYIKDAFWKY